MPAFPGGKTKSRTPIHNANKILKHIPIEDITETKSLIQATAKIIEKHAMPTKIQTMKLTVPPYKRRTEKKIEFTRKEISQMTAVVNNNGKGKAALVQKYYLN